VSVVEYHAEMLLDLLSAALGTFVALLPIANPFSTAAVFVAITQRFTEAQSRDQAWRACIYMAIVLLVALFAGALIMEFFGISIPALRVAGGLIVARVGFGMLNPEPEPDVGEVQQEEALHMADLAFTPLAMPMLSGPGSIAVTIGMAAGIESRWEYVAIAVGIVMVAYLSWLVLRSARRIVSLLGSTGMVALTRVMGFLLVCVGIQFIGAGVLQFLSDEETIRALLAGIEAANKR
jgi:multiple antibiotic resistance protein